MMRRFTLNRVEDVTGISGIGPVAEGIQFSDGSCVLHWRPPYSCTIVHSSIENVKAVHCHADRTIIEWRDGRE